MTSKRSAAEAHASFRALRAKFPNQLGGRSAIVRRTDLGAKGIYYRTMVGPFASMEKATGNMPHTESCRRQLPHPTKLRGALDHRLVLAEIAGTSSCAPKSLSRTTHSRRAVPRIFMLLSGDRQCALEIRCRVRRVRLSARASLSARSCGRRKRGRSYARLVSNRPSTGEQLAVTMTTRARRAGTVSGGSS